MYTTNLAGLAVERGCCGSGYAAFSGSLYQAAVWLYISSGSGSSSGPGSDSGSGSGSSVETKYYESKSSIGSTGWGEGVNSAKPVIWVL